MENLNIPGVYEIVNKINNKVYIGSTKNIRKRRNYHFRYLKNNNHPNKKLQNAYNKYGENNFSFNIIYRIVDFEDIVNLKEKLLNSEQYWMDYYNSYGIGGYNIAKIAGSCLGIKMSESQKIMLRKAHAKNSKPVINMDTGQIFESMSSARRHTGVQPFSISRACRGIAEIAGGFKWAFILNGKPDIKEFKTKRRVSVANLSTGKIFKSIVEAAKFYDICADKISRVCYGKSHLAGGFDWAIISGNEIKLRKDFVHKKLRKVINIDTGEFFDSIAIASRKYNLNRSHISAVCNGTRKRCGNYRWAYVDSGVILEQDYGYKPRYSGKSIINIDNGEIFENVHQIHVKYNKKHSHVCAVCSGRRSKALGFHWMYYEDYLKQQDIDNKDN